MDQAPTIRMQGSTKIPSLHLGNAHPLEQFEIEGYVQDLYICPDCPTNAQCNPCGSYMAISDSPQSCLKPSIKTVLACPDILIIELDYPNNYSRVTRGTKIKLKVETNISANITQMITPEDKQRNASYQQILKDTLDKQPFLKRSPRPAWLKDVPGETYTISK